MYKIYHQNKKKRIADTIFWRENANPMLPHQIQVRSKAFSKLNDIIDTLTFQSQFLT